MFLKILPLKSSWKKLERTHANIDASNQKALSSKESTTEHSKILCNLQEQPPAPDISIQSLGEPFCLSLLYIIIAEICITIDE